MQIDVASIALCRAATTLIAQPLCDPGLTGDTVNLTSHLDGLIGTVQTMRPFEV